ncbi:GNAT family N-acetyltransferase [Rhizocola hellebori]|nr:GNAT family N-acetyltransferase [Rhizocola hellebori]
MSRLDVRPFAADDIPSAGRLLAQRHRRHRLAQPLLSARFEDVEVAVEAVRAAFEADDASGAVAWRDGEMVGYLLGAPKPSPLWGPNVWVEAAGQAVTEADVMRDLYGVAATRWVPESGFKAQYVIVPATDQELVRAWFRLGFGQQHAHGIRGLPTGPPSPTKVVIRRAARADIPTLAQLEVELPAHQGLAPTFSAGKVPTVEENIAEWEEDFDDPSYATFVAELDGEVVGSAVGCALSKSSSHAGPASVDNAGFLGFAAVFPSARGAGAGRALGEAVLAWAAESGFDCVVTDWRVTNLLSSRAWPALGFEETFLRLHRLVGY